MRGENDSWKTSFNKAPGGGAMGSEMVAGRPQTTEQWPLENANTKPEQVTRHDQSPASRTSFVGVGPGVLWYYWQGSATPFQPATPGLSTC